MTVVMPVSKQREQDIAAQRANAIVQSIDLMLKAYIARYVHMSTNDKPIIAAQEELAALIAEAIQ